MVSRFESRGERALIRSPHRGPIASIFAASVGEPTDKVPSAFSSWQRLFTCTIISYLAVDCRTIAAFASKSSVVRLAASPARQGVLGPYSEPLLPQEDSAMLTRTHGQIDFEDLLHWKLE